MKLLFVCTGNTCRSPMAEALMRRKLQERALTDWQVLSAGLAADGSPAAQYAVEVLAEQGLNLTRHRSRSLTRSLCEEADRIAVMTPDQAVLLGMLFGVPQEKIVVLGGGIPDPYGGDIETYRRTRDALDKALDALLPPAGETA